MRDRLLRSRIAAIKKSILLLGPRQVGKSTLAHSFKPQLIVDLADEETFLAYSKDPARLKREIAGLNQGSTVVIDEVQRAPQILNTIQSILDSNGAKVRFLLTGSSARKLRRRSVNLLPGRVIREYLDPLLVAELGDDFALDRALQIGMLPGIYLDHESGIDVLGSYAEIYLREEIRVEALAQNIGNYARFLDVIALMSGQWLNYSKLSSDTEIPKETVRRYMGVLEDTLLAFRIPAFRPREKISRRISQRDKIFLFDVGVRNALLGLHRRPLSIDQIGSIFEQWLVLQIIYLNRALRKEWTISSYRTEAGAEVDLVIETANEILGVEIKSGKNVAPKQLSGLASLGEVVGRYKPYRRYVAYQGMRAQLFEDGTEALPYLELLTRLQSFS